ncbi:MAG: hypothetical protein M3536_09605, partial [Actinomycetota bacterium]|nr:hypothetical protein [Actinomycetota bacterium]
KDAGKAQEILKTAIDETGVGLEAVIEDMDKFLEQLFASGMITMSARDANAAYHDALRDIPDTLKTIAESNGAMGRTLNDAATDFDLTTEAGSLANAAFQDVSRKGMAEVKAAAEEGMGQDGLQAKLSRTYEDLVIAADGMGITGQAGRDLALDVLGVPDGVDIHTWMSTEAKRVAGETKTAIDNIPKRVEVNIDTYRTTFEKLVGLPPQIADGSKGQGAGVLLPQLLKSTGGKILGYSNGGQLPSTGPGTGVTDGFLGIDSAGIPRARLDANEWIINGYSSERYNRELAAINAGTFPKMPGYANG